MSHHGISRKHPKPSNDGDWHLRWPVWAISTILLLFDVFVIVREYREDSPQKSDIPIIVVSEGQNLNMEQSKLRSQQPHLFEASASGLKVKLVVQRTPDQIVYVCRQTGDYSARNAKETTGS